MDVFIVGFLGTLEFLVGQKYMWQNGAILTYDTSIKQSAQSGQEAQNGHGVNPTYLQTRL